MWLYASKYLYIFINILKIVKVGFLKYIYLDHSL